MGKVNQIVAGSDKGIKYSFQSLQIPVFIILALKTL